jgi:uncharacterized protein (TIGR02118 family)
VSSTRRDGVPGRRDVSTDCRILAGPA